MEDLLDDKLTGGVEREGEEEVVEELEATDTQEESEPEVEPVKEVAKAEPFHKNPKFRRLQAEAEELRKYREDSEKRFEALQAEIRGIKPQDAAPQTVPENLRHIFGDDYAAYKALQDHLVENYRGVTREELKALTAQEEARQRAAEQAEAKIIQNAESQLAELAEETGLSFDDMQSDARNKLLDICEQYGINDFQKAYMLYEQLYPAGEADVERKKLAANTSSRGSSGSSSADKPLTKNSLKKIKFNSFFN